MAAYAALVSLVNNIQQIMNHPSLATSLDKNQIQSLVEKAGFLLDFVEENNYGGGSKAAEDLERQIASAAHAAEDVIESHVVDQIHVRTSPGRSLHLQQIIKDMDTVMERATELKQNRRSREEAMHLRTPIMETGESGGMVGLDEELIQILDHLTGEQSKLSIISIVGMGGMGKTTLAKNIYQNLLIKDCFQFRAWATVSEQDDAQKILSQLLSDLEKFTSGNLGEQLHKTLSGRKYLIILDDVWSVEAWDKVRLFFPDNGNGSRVILTTRMSNVARDCQSSIFTMELLDEGKSWNLFREKVFQKANCPAHLEKIGKEIVRLCKGLALCIVVMGGLLLKAPRTVGYWEVVVRDLKSIPISKEKQESLDVLALSYYHLPPHLKPCFLYMGVFEEDAHSRVSNIIKVWVAEGFIKPNGTRVLEEIAEDNLNDLIDRNLVQGGRLRYNGKIGSCSIHDLLRDLCLKLGGQEDFFHENKYFHGIGERVRRLVCSWYLPIETPVARSIIKRWPDHHTNPIKYRLLRVLVEPRPSSLKELYENVNLRYLSYNHPSDNTQSTWKLPPSVSLMWNLQTLLIKVEHYTSPMVVAPIEIWNMRQLRHVECYQIYLPIPLPSSKQDELVILDNFRTLKVAVNLRLCHEVCKIIPNIKKLHLVYDGELKGYDDSLIESLCNLSRMHKLESLNMSFKGSKWPSQLNRGQIFPSSLNKLSLRNCKLHWDALGSIGELPQLQVLNLISSVTGGERWSPIRGQFPRLKFLHIETCGLMYWDAESYHFPNLEKIVLHNLWNLNEIPLGIGEITTLELIRVSHCKLSASISALKIKENQEYEGNDSLQVQLRMYDNSYLKRFKEMVGKERLATGNIQLEI